MTPTRWIIFAVVIVLGLGGLVALSSKDKVDVSNVDTNAVVKTGEHADRIFGNQNAKVVLMEYGDFQCPGCGGAYPQLKMLSETYKDNMAFVFRHFPLTTIHPNALAAAAVAEAAGKQNKFWEMHDLLYTNQSAWENLKAEQRGTVFEGYASQLGLNMDQYKSDVASKGVAATISYDRALGGKAGVDSTPTVFLNGEKMPTDVVNDLVQNKGDLLKARIEAAIKASGGTLPSTATS